MLKERLLKVFDNTNKRKYFSYTKYDDFIYTCIVIISTIIKCRVPKSSILSLSQKTNCCQNLNIKHLMFSSQIFVSLLV